MDFFTSAILGGIVYDLLKIGLVLSRDNLQEKLSQYTNDEDLIRQLVDILDKKAIHKDIDRDELEKILESDKQVTNIIDSINNTINNTNNNTINNTNSNNNTINNTQMNQKGNITNINGASHTKRKLTDAERKRKENKLDKSEKVFKLILNPELEKKVYYSILLLFIIVGQGFISYIFKGYLFWGVIVLMVVSVFFISEKIIKFLSQNITIYHNKFLLKNEEILYSNIEIFQRSNRKVFYKLKDKSEHIITFFDDEGVNYLEKQYDTYKEAMQF